MNRLASVSGAVPSASLRQALTGVQARAFESDVLAIDRRRHGQTHAILGVGLDVLGAGVTIGADRLTVLQAGALEVAMVQVGVQGVRADADGVQLVGLPGGK
jgi:hypothetical protein